MKLIEPKELEQMINESNNIVFFSGAGVSTDSGLKAFRGKNGLFNTKYHNYQAEEILSHSFYLKNPLIFYDFYRQAFLSTRVLPNYTHHWLKELEDSGKLKAIITQNIDGLHQAAGSSNVIELHGSIHRNYTVTTHRLIEGFDIILNSDGIPLYDGEVVKPDVVLYEESLDSQVLSAAINELRRADLVIVAGTSLMVYPAAGLIGYTKAKYVVGINEEAIELDYLVKGNCSEILKQINIS